MLPLNEEFGWGSTEIMFVATLISALAGICSSFVGRLLYSYGAKNVIAAGGIHLRNTLKSTLFQEPFDLGTF